MTDTVLPIRPLCFLEHTPIIEGSDEIAIPKWLFESWLDLFPPSTPMLMAIKDHYDKTGIMVGMKPAGGISTSKLALHYLVMVNEVLGEKWLSNEWFRFGASSLANDVLMQIAKTVNGSYQSADYFSID